MKQTMMVGQLLAKRCALDDMEQVLLGRGGMGAVFDATDTPSGELVAVKLSDRTSEVLKTSEVRMSPAQQETGARGPHGSFFAEGLGDAASLTHQVCSLP